MLSQSLKIKEIRMIILRTSNSADRLADVLIFPRVND